MKSFALALASVLLVLTIFEVGLRFAGYEPSNWKPPRRDVPVMSNRDAELGWVSRPGTYRYHHSGHAIRTDDSRGTTSTNGSNGEIWFFGCSFTQGWGISDGKEFPALVSRNAPGWTVRNFAVPGYSTLQSKMLYERLSQDLPTKPRLVVYGYAGGMMGETPPISSGWPPSGA